MAQVAFAVVRAKVALRLAAHTFFPTNSGCVALETKKRNNNNKQNKHFMDAY